MTLLQVILVAIIPAAMVIYGKRTRKRTSPVKDVKSSFLTRRAVKSQEAWNYVHKLFSNLMFVIGINVLVCSEAFYLAVRVFKHETYWICVGALVAAQVLGVIMAYLFCSWMVRRAFDVNGELIDPYAEKEEEAEAGETVETAEVAADAEGAGAAGEAGTADEPAIDGAAEEPATDGAAGEAGTEEPATDGATEEAGTETDGHSTEAEDEEGRR